MEKSSISPIEKARPKLLYLRQTDFYAFIFSISSIGFAVAVTHAGLKPDRIALRADGIFDHAQQ